jgi:hypothetical protein
MPTDGVGAAKSANENLGTFSFQRQLTGRLSLPTCSLFHDAGIKAQGVAQRIRSVIALFSETSGDAPREAWRIAKIVRTRS